MTLSEIRYVDAINAVLRDELARDPAVLILGEDVASGGPFGATNHLLEEFGSHRVRNTPISEGTVVGLAVGAAMTGLRPIVEIMFMDFVTLAMDQVVNHAAKMRYMSDGHLQVPLTLRVQGGVGGGMGAQHSQSLEAWFTHIPGLRVVVPATPADAMGLLRTAIRSDDPVVCFEHRGLYWSRGPVDDSRGPMPFGHAAVLRRGSDVSVVAWSRMVGVVLEAAEDLAGEGISVEIIDLRTLCPLDLGTVVESVVRTGRMLIVHEAVEYGGFGAELAARVQAEAFDDLAGPIRRIGAPFGPVPAAPNLEREYLPSADRIVATVRSMVKEQHGSARGAGV